MSALETDGWVIRDNYTHGNYTTEAESVAAFDDIIEQLGLFIVMREVTGQYTQLNLDQQRARPRIDRILAPTPQLRQLGWEHGVIGVECKRSGEKIGKPISQMLDYRRALFPLGAAHVVLNYVLLWPWQGCGGPVASIMAQQRLGNIYGDTYGLYLASGGQTLARFGTNKQPELISNRQGRKVGSR